MQKDLANATETLADGLNQIHQNTKTINLVTLVKRQVEEIEKRNMIVSKMQETVQLQQDNINKLLEQNKHLEALLSTIREERQKLLEEIKDLKTKKTRTPRAKKVKQDETVTDAA